MSADESEDILEERLWKKSGWIARVIKNEDDEGWAVEMTRAGDSEPALVGPWTMGRDKKNPKPLDPRVCHAGEDGPRGPATSEQAAHSALHKSRTITDDPDRRIRVDRRRLTKTTARDPAAFDDLP